MLETTSPRDKSRVPGLRQEKSDNELLFILFKIKGLGSHTIINLIKDWGDIQTLYHKHQEIPGKLGSLFQQKFSDNTFLIRVQLFETFLDRLRYT